MMTFPRTVIGTACALLASAFLVGCSVAPSQPPLSPDHPASPQAAEAPPLAPSNALTSGRDLSALDSSGSDGHAAGQHDMAQHDMGHMDHGMDMSHDMAGMHHGGSSAPSPAATTQSASATYTCVMHPEVVSDKPGKCPKCSMKLVAKKQQQGGNNQKGAAQ